MKKLLFFTIIFLLPCLIIAEDSKFILIDDYIVNVDEIKLVKYYPHNGKYQIVINLKSRSTTVGLADSPVIYLVPCNHTQAKRKIKKIYMLINQRLLNKL